MPLESQLAHRNVRAANLPYVTNIAPTSTEPCYISGSQDLMTGINGYAERRPGFADQVELVDGLGATSTVFVNLQRLFTWDRFDGTFIVMACDVTSSSSIVYKMIVGVDANFAAIYTDSTTSAPFDFVTSNNTVYFSNGATSKKWDPVNGLTNWGISIGSMSGGTGPNYCGTGSQISTGSAWSTPTNIQGAGNSTYAAVTLSNSPTSTNSAKATTAMASGASTTGIRAWSVGTNSASCGLSVTWDHVALDFSQTNNETANLSATGAGFVIPSGAAISGIVASFKRHGNTSSNGYIRDLTVKLLKNGAVVGSNKATTTQWPTTSTTASYGASNDLWGTTWTSTDINNSYFGLALAGEWLGYGDATAAATAYLDTQVTITVYYSYTPSGTLYSQTLTATNYGFSIASTSTVNGIFVEISGLQTQTASTYINAYLLKNGAVATGAKKVVLPAANGYITLGSSSDLWGATWTYNDVSQTTFGVGIQAVNANGASTTFDVDAVRITLYTTGGPSVSLTGTGLTASTGYQYVVCYGNSNSGHISSPSLPSNVVKPSNQAIQITLTASSDAQVNQIHVYRSTDSVASGTTAANYFEIPTSPYANSNATVTDSAPDTSLSATQIAPLPGFNDPPPAMRGMVYFSGRIWGFANNKVYFTDLEECTMGVPEESWVSGVAGNYWNFDQPVQGLAVAGILDGQILAILCGGRIYGITGNSLDTFRRFSVSHRRGTRNLTCVSSLGGMVAWLDSANQVWTSDGSSLQEISQPIRPDLVNLNPANCSLTFHAQGKYHWLLLSTGTNVYAYDLDTEQWMPPWTFPCSYLYSGEVAPGQYRLMAAQPTIALQLSSTAHNDNGSTYQPIGATNMMAMVPDFGNRFSYMAMGIYDEPSRAGLPWEFQIDTNSAGLSDVQYQVDDDPSDPGVSFTSIFANSQPITVLNRNSGSVLVQNLYTMNGPSARWASFKIFGQNADDNLRIYGWFLAYKGLGGR